MPTNLNLTPKQPLPPKPDPRQSAAKPDPRRSAAGKQNPTDQAKVANKPKVAESRAGSKPTIVPIPVKAAASKPTGAADKATTPTPTAASKQPAKDSTPTPAQKTNGAPPATPDVATTPPATPVGSKAKTPVGPIRLEKKTKDEILAAVTDPAGDEDSGSLICVQPSQSEVNIDEQKKLADLPIVKAFNEAEKKFSQG